MNFYITNALKSAIVNRNIPDFFLSKMNMIIFQTWKVNGIKKGIFTGLSSIKKSITLGLIFTTGLIYAQEGKNLIEGQILDAVEISKPTPLIGANVFWLNSTSGTVSDKNGKFVLKRITSTSKLVVSYIGYLSDTIETSQKNIFEINLKPDGILNEVVILKKRKTTEVSYIDPIKVENIGEKELLKAACCNLSESFETSPSIDVSFTDAVTGTRQIQLLGLAGPYTQITRENMPDVRGLSAIQGLTFVPGTWIESIQLNKGTGSVTNGYESIAGQINVELRKPEEADKLYLNLYSSEGGRFEGNLNLANKLNEIWSTGTLLHAKTNVIEWDRNKDGFLDNPLGESFIGVHRWKYIGQGGTRIQLGVKGTYVDNIAGQTGFAPQGDLLANNLWGMQFKVQRLEGWTKIGRVYEDKPWKSIGLQMQQTYHDQKSYYGRRQYDATQNSYYANLLYQSILNTSFHKFKTGASFQFDQYDEYFIDTTFLRQETVPGAFFEYTFSQTETFDFVFGGRGDYHNQYGLFFTPRFNMRYALNENNIVRATVGRGKRTANILAENQALLASSRDILFLGTDKYKPYGLEQESAWNFGLNLNRTFLIADRDGTFGIDVYRTDFENQIIIDLEQSPQQAIIYNLDGKSFSNSLQLQLDYELLKNLNIRIAYRWYDLQTTYNGELLSKPLLSRHRAFANLAYETINAWKFDYTINWQGTKRIPNTQSNPTPYNLAKRSPAFILMNAQISKSWKKVFELYLGAENLLNFKQSDAILSADQPFGPYFDGTLIWGPVFGRMVYVGLRYKIE